ncbi:hypothetical protein ACWGDT_04195 [Streptomyces avermitilis]
MATRNTGGSPGDAADPRADGNSRPAGSRRRRDAAAALSHQLSAGAWPEFGEHPVLMLLHVSGDERVDSLRRQALPDFSRQVLEASGTQPTRDGQGGQGDRGDQASDERLSCTHPRPYQS